MFRDQNTFQPTIEAAAEHLGIGATAVEKDYWVSQALRVLAEHYPNDFVFKGGTSLSKGYGLIERFSEGIDLLILKGTRGGGAIDRLMKDMGTTVADHLGAKPVATSSGRGEHRAYRVAYPTSRVGITAFETTILMEMGVRGGAQPSQLVEIGTLLSDALIDVGTDVSEMSDLQPFTVTILHPGRTLLEKLYVVHGEALRLSRDPTASVTPRTGRHFYDVSQLLADDEVAAFLGDDSEVDRVLNEIEEITHKYFKADDDAELRPEGGFRISPAFDLSSDVSRRLREAYEFDMEELYFGTAQLPTWKAICERAASSPI